MGPLVFIAGVVVGSIGGLLSEWPTSLVAALQQAIAGALMGILIGALTEFLYFKPEELSS